MPPASSTIKSSSPPTVLLVPGWLNSGPEHWQSLWEKSNPHFVRVVQKNWTEPVPKDWVLAIERAIDAAPGPVVIAAHSLGCLACQMISPIHLSRIVGALLVAAADLDRSECPRVLENFRPMPIQKIPFRSILVVSSNDDWATLERSEQFASQWGSDLVNIGPRGHINSDSGLAGWPDGFALLEVLTHS